MKALNGQNIEAYHPLFPICRPQAGGRSEKERWRDCSGLAVKLVHPRHKVVGVAETGIFTKSDYDRSRTEGVVGVCGKGNEIVRIGEVYEIVKKAPHQLFRELRRKLYRFQLFRPSLSRTDSILHPIIRAVRAIRSHKPFRMGSNYFVSFAENYPKSDWIVVRYEDVTTLESDNSKSGRRQRTAKLPVRLRLHGPQAGAARGY